MVEGPARRVAEVLSSSLSTRVIVLSRELWRARSLAAFLSSLHVWWEHGANLCWAAKFRVQRASSSCLHALSETSVNVDMDVRAHLNELFDHYLVGPSKIQYSLKFWISCLYVLFERFWGKQQKLNGECDHKPILSYLTCLPTVPLSYWSP